MQPRFVSRKEGSCLIVASAAQRAHAPVPKHRDPALLGWCMADAWQPAVQHRIGGG